MLGATSYQLGYIVWIRETGYDFSPPAWTLEAPVVATLLEKTIEKGHITEPGIYLLRLVVIDGREKLQFIDITDDVA
jgi:hypothetical protein